MGAHPTPSTTTALTDGACGAIWIKFFSFDLTVSILRWGACCDDYASSTLTRSIMSWSVVMGVRTSCAMISIAVGYRNSLVTPWFAAPGMSTRSRSCMSNHLHLVLKTPQPNLSRGMQSFLLGYANAWS
jgi:hypothetical protein